LISCGGLLWGAIVERRSGGGLKQDHLRKRADERFCRNDRLRRAFFDYDNDGWLDIFLVMGRDSEP